MNLGTRLAAFTVLALLLLAANQASASGGGITGRSMTGCGSCHSAGNLNLSLSGGPTVEVGSQASLFLSISGGPQVECGLNVSVSAGELVDVSSATRLQSGEITHTSPNPSCSFQFDWIPPDDPKVTEAQIFFAVNSVNGNNGSSGDAWDTGSTTLLVSRTDLDGDGFAVNFDNCPNVTNPDQADDDRDGTGNSCQSLIATLDWRPGSIPPQTGFSPNDPDDLDIIDVSISEGGGSNSCFATPLGLSGGPFLVVDPEAFEIESHLGVPTDQSFLCPLSFSPVAGLVGQIGPLEAGIWTFTDVQSGMEFEIPVTVAPEPSAWLSGACAIAVLWLIARGRSTHNGHFAISSSSGFDAP